MAVGQVLCGFGVLVRTAGCFDQGRSHPHWQIPGVCGVVGFYLGGCFPCEMGLRHCLRHCHGDRHTLCRVGVRGSEDGFHSAACSV